MFKILKAPEFPLIHCSQHNEIVDRLAEIIDVHEHNDKVYRGEIERLKGVIAGLQNAPKKPQIKPSSIEKPTPSKKPTPRSPNGSKADRLPIHHTITIEPKNIPQHSVFKGFRSYFVQDMEIRPVNTLFKLARWQTPEGKYVTGELPREYQGFHFGPTLRTFIIQQCHLARVTQPRLLQQLADWDIEISEGELDRIICSQTSLLESELDQVLDEGLKHSPYIQTDDTGARHKGANQVCTHLGNHLFTYFETGPSKSRLRFLELLNREGRYLLNEASIDYLRQQSSLKLIRLVEGDGGRVFEDKRAFHNYLDEKNIEGKKHRRTLQEAALIGYLQSYFGKDFTILSDGAPQYAILNHAACWVHALRLLEKDRPIRGEKADVILGKLRFLYHHLKRYRRRSSPVSKRRLSHYFDQICDLRTGSQGFDKALKRLFLNRQDLLRVLENPLVPLHNNLSENDLREYVVRRKLSGGTRSDLGKRTRDLFCSLVKTCLKLGISFWEYLKDRVWQKAEIPPLSQIFRQKALLTSTF